MVDKADKDRQEAGVADQVFLSTGTRNGISGLTPLHFCPQFRVPFEMSDPLDNFRDRVVAAAEAALKGGGSVGPLDLFQHLRWLQPAHFEGWRKGNEHCRVLEQWIQVGPEKLQKALRCFAEWVQARGFRPIEASYTRRSPGGVEMLQVTADCDPEREKFYRTRYVPAELTERKSRKPPYPYGLRPIADEWCRAPGRPRFSARPDRPGAGPVARFRDQVR